MLQYASSSRNPQIEDTRANEFQAGCPNIPFSVRYLSSFMMTTDSLLTHFCALAEFQVLLQKAKKMTKRALSRQTLDCSQGKAFKLRAYRNGHLGTLMRCCEAWKPIEDCFDTLSFECIDFQRRSQIFASLTRENLEARETEVSTFPWTQTEKTLLWLAVGMPTCLAQQETCVISQCCHG